MMRLGMVLLGLLVLATAPAAAASNGVGDGNGVDLSSGGPLPDPAVGMSPSMPAVAITTTVSRTMCSSGCDFGSLRDFFDFVQGSTFRQGGSVVLQIASGRYDSGTAGWFITDPKFANVTIRGENCADPTRTVLLFHNSGNNLAAFNAFNGGRLGYIDCLTIQGVGARVDRDTWVEQSYGGGLQAYGSGSNIHAGAHIKVDSFYYSAVADEGGHISVDADEKQSTYPLFMNAGDVNVFARHGGMIHCWRCHAVTASHLHTPGHGDEQLGANYMAEAGGHLDIAGSTGSDAQVLGAGARLGGSIWAHGITETGSKGCGIEVDEGGRGEFNFGSTSSHNSCGVTVTGGGFANLDNITIKNNLFDGVSVSGSGSIAQGHAMSVSNNGAYGIKATMGGSIVATASKKLIIGNGFSNTVFVDGPHGPCSGNMPIGSGLDCAPAASVTIN